VQIHGCSRGAAAWIQPHCSNHTGRVRVVKTQQEAAGNSLVGIERYLSER